jgi:hypothetical protein
MRAQWRACNPETPRFSAHDLLILSSRTTSFEVNAAQSAEGQEQEFYAVILEMEKQARLGSADNGRIGSLANDRSERDAGRRSWGESRLLPRAGSRSSVFGLGSSLVEALVDFEDTVVPLKAMDSLVFSGAAGPYLGAFFGTTLLRAIRRKCRLTRSGELTKDLVAVLRWRATAKSVNRAPRSVVTNPSRAPTAAAARPSVADLSATT